MTSTLALGIDVNTVLCMDALAFLKTLPDECVNCIVTSPPYFGLRDYGVEGQLGLEETPEAYVSALVDVFREARRVLRSDGTFWLNLGDSYSAGGRGSSKHHEAYLGAGTAEAQKMGPKKTPGYGEKQLLMMPARVALALQADGWVLRSEIVWSKPNTMPESVTDRPTKAHEMIYLLTKSPDYFFDAEAIKEAAVGNDMRDVAGSEGVLGGPNKRLRSTNRKSFRGGGAYTHDQAFNNSTKVGNTTTGNELNLSGKRNKRTVWTVSTVGFSGAHFATFPPALIEPMILAGCPKGGLVYDPFFGAGTVGLVAQQNGRNWIGSEINPEYCALARARINGKFEQYQAEKAGLPFMQSMFD